jgi:hypothetical protein
MKDLPAIVVKNFCFPWRRELFVKLTPLRLCGKDGGAFMASEAFEPCCPPHGLWWRGKKTCTQKGLAGGLDIC